MKSNNGLAISLRLLTSSQSARSKLRAFPFSYLNLSLRVERYSLKLTSRVNWSLSDFLSIMRCVWTPGKEITELLHLHVYRHITVSPSRKKDDDGFQQPIWWLLFAKNKWLACCSILLSETLTERKLAACCMRIFLFHY